MTLLAVREMFRLSAALFAPWEILAHALRDYTRLSDHCVHCPRTEALIGERPDWALWQQGFRNDCLLSYALFSGSPKLFDIGNKDFEFRLLKTVLLPLCSCCWDQPLEQIEFVMNNNGMLLADQDLFLFRTIGIDGGGGDGRGQQTA